MRNRDDAIIYSIIFGGVLSVLILFGFPTKGAEAAQEPQNSTIVEAVHVNTTQVEIPVVTYLDAASISNNEVPAEEYETAPDHGAIEPLNLSTTSYDLSKETEVEEDIQVSTKQYDDNFIDRCRLTYAESGLEDIIGQEAVAATILNRQESEDFPNSLWDVMTQNGAFSSVKNGEIYIMCSDPYILDYEDIPDCTIEATQKALDGEDPTEELLWNEALRLGLDPEVYAKGGALFFYNPDACSDSALQERECIQCKVKIGHHIFYKVWG